MNRIASRALRSRSVLRQSIARSVTRPAMVSVAGMATKTLSVEPPLPSSHPTDAFQLLAEENKPSAEDEIFNEQVQQVKRWWTSPRYEGIKRPYSAEQVVSKRGTLQQVYPSSLMARKLFDLLEKRSKEGKPVHTSKRVKEMM